MRVLQIEKVLVVHKTVLPFKKQWNKLDYDDTLNEHGRDLYVNDDVIAQFECCADLDYDDKSKIKIKLHEKLKRHPRQINVTKEVRIGKKLLGWKLCKYLDHKLGNWYKRMLLNEKGKWYIRAAGKHIEVPSRFIRLRRKRISKPKKKEVEEEVKKEDVSDEKDKMRIMHFETIPVSYDPYTKKIY
eukprot:TRINITY_DN205_c1_g1_i1.p1 TRINITY_DN205_c1_g1~~TRINITY_DN205_c1_g1_i1.p1  ORF type:complete len:186 (+),score=26.12 TRINITY_DN205_c1_g1_i1:2-559(+)